MIKITHERMVHIIDDDESVRKSLSRLMRSVDIECRVYESGEHFFTEVRNEGIACILLDISMPYMNGFQLIEKLKEKKFAFPVIAISAIDDQKMRQLARDEGLQFFLSKPVDDQALLDAISWVMNDIQVP